MGDLSLSFGQQSQAPSNFREKAFGARKLDIEDVLNNLINEINLAPSKCAEWGDMSRVNLMMEGLVLNLDAVVYNVLTAGKRKKFASYEERRGKIFQGWPKQGDAPTPLVRELYGLCISVVAEEKLFKMRRTLFFSEGWQRDRELAMHRMEEEAERDSLDQDEADVTAAD
jgi:hypothetical protein